MAPLVELVASASGCEELEQGQTCSFANAYCDVYANEAMKRGQEEMARMQGVSCRLMDEGKVQLAGS